MSINPRLPPDLRDHAVVLAYLTSHAQTSMLAPGALICFLASDDPEHPPVAIVVEDMPSSPPQHERIMMISTIVASAAQAGCRDFVLVVCRFGTPPVTGDDLAWHDAAYSVASHAGPTCQGLYVAARGRVTRVVPASARSATQA